MSKSIKKVVSVLVSNASSASPYAAPPAVHAPAPPDGFDPSERASRKVPGPTHAMAALAASVAAELAAADLVKDFGAKHAPGTLPKALEQAAAWRTERQRAEQWLAYVKEGDAQAWRPALKAVERFRKAYVLAASVDPTLRERYPDTDAFFRSKSAAAARASQTRQTRRKAKGKGKSAGPAAPASAPTTAPAAAPALALVPAHSSAAE